jgi:hypothetical protein
MKFTLTIKATGSAFYDGQDQEVFSPEWELNRLLNIAAKHVKEGQFAGTLVDLNGQTVGSFNMEREN